MLIFSKDDIDVKFEIVNFASRFKWIFTHFIFAQISCMANCRWGAIGFSVLIIPSIVIPVFWMGSAGTHKYKVKDAMVVRLDKKNGLMYDNTIDGKNSGFHHAREAVNTYDNKEYFQVSNSGTKSTYIVVDDAKDVIIYNLNQKKIVRTVSHKDGKSRINIYPAKEGHIMVSEYNKQEKYTRMPIESL